MLINQREGHQCCCPLCQLDKQNIGATYPWFSPTGQLICIYALCDVCDAAANHTKKDIQAALFQEIEKNLISTYPSIKAHLSKDYDPSAQKIHLVRPNNFTVHLRSEYPAELPSGHEKASIESSNPENLANNSLP